MRKTEEVHRQDLLLALADNLQDTMQQFISVMELISDNSLKIKDMGEEISRLTNEFLNISNQQMEINDYISRLVIDTNDRAEKLRENIKLLHEEGQND